MTAAVDVRSELGAEVFRIHQLAADVERLYEESDGLVTEESEALEAFLADTTATTLEALLRYREEIETQRLGIKAQLDRLHAKQEALGRRDRWAEAMVFVVMGRMGVRKADAGTFAVTICRGREVARAAEYMDMDKLPESLVAVSVTRKPKLKEILEALKAGAEVEGFSIGHAPDYLRIR